MLVIDDKTLWATGLSYDEAVALLDPPEDELVVHVQRVPRDDDSTAPAVTSVAPPDAEKPQPSAQASVQAAAPPMEDGAKALPHAGIHTGDSVAIERRTVLIEDRGYSLGEVEAMAKEQRMSLVAGGGVYTLSNVFVMKHFESLAEVVAQLRLCHGGRTRRE